MSMGTLTVAWLLLATGTTAVEVVPINQRNFQIPIRIDQGRKSQIKELLLFASTDQGASWKQVAMATPDKESFVYYAPADGLYWFSVAVVDARGNREPQDIFKTPPGQKVLIDTVRPVIRFTAADRHTEEINVGWEIQEERPDLATLKVDYRTADAPQWSWIPVAASPALNGQTRFRPTTAGTVIVRVQVQDQAGNIGSSQTELHGPAAAAQAQPFVPPPAPVVPATTASASPVVSPSAVPIMPLPPPSGAAMQGSAPAPSVSAWDRGPAVQTSLTTTEPRGMVERNWPPGPAPSYSPTNYNYADPNTRLVATSVGGGQFVPPASTPGLGGSRRPSGSLSELTSNPQITLNYQVDKVGPSGVGSVELWLSQNDGRSWRRFAEDEDLKPPLMVELPGEGVYGLFLVVRSRAGLGRRPPQDGDLPQMRVEVDLTPPVAQLYAPEPDPQRPGALVLTWNVADRNMGSNPITLQWAERPDLPWQTIAGELPNSGRYVWQLPPGLPGRVHLKLLARDAAGNICQAQTGEPLLVDLSEPEGQLLGIVTTTRRP